MEETPQTLYVNNLPEKVSKSSLKNSLYMVFSQYGKVIEIVACKGIKLRGQVKIKNGINSYALMRFSFEYKVCCSGELLGLGSI